jgi:hypothetical protein
VVYDNSTRIPAVITHLYDPQRGPFRNICNLAEEEAERILAEIRNSGRPNLKSNYLPRRRKTEAWLMSERYRKQGWPYLDHPVYFFLGDRSDWRHASRPASVVLPLKLFPEDALTFTFPDSMASLPLATEDRYLADRRDYHGKVFTLAEIDAVIAEVGMPSGRDRYDTFVEVQVWDDRALCDLAFLGAIASERQAGIGADRAGGAVVPPHLPNRAIALT